MAKKKDGTIPWLLLTLWDHPQSGVVTMQGKVRYDMWLERERDRIAAQHGRQARIVERDGKLALAVNDPCLCSMFKASGVGNPRAICRCADCVQFRENSYWRET